MKLFQYSLVQYIAKIDMVKIFFKSIRILIKLIFPILKRVEKKLVLHQTEFKSYPIYIIGSLRTGSTILYQLITNVFDLNYIDNLMCLFCKTPLIGQSLSKFFFGNSPHNSYTSKFGDTYINGFHAPSECGGFWYNWLSKEHHYINNNEIDEDACKDMAKTIYTLIDKQGKPFVFKNLYSGQRINLLKKTTPNAKYIFIQRNPVDTIKSIYKARHKLKIKPNEWWGIESKNHKDLMKLDEINMITSQVYFLEKQISEDLKTIPQVNIMKISYETIFKDYNALIERIHNFIGKDIEFRKNIKNPILGSQNKKKNHSQLEEKINIAMKQHDWSSLYEL